jgi:Uma2 family endonuclease
MSAVAPRFTSADLEAMPEDGKRYEIIDGELYVSRQPGYEHQYICGRLLKFIDNWNDPQGLGITLFTPGIIFSEDNDVAPDVVWISRERLAANIDKAGHLHTAPELVIEVLSPGTANMRRDREIKRKLYSRHGVREYWLVDGMQRQVDVYRREHAALQHTATLFAQDTLVTPLLPGFVCPITSLFL